MVQSRRGRDPNTQRHGRIERSPPLRQGRGARYDSEHCDQLGHKVGPCLGDSPLHDDQVVHRDEAVRRLEGAARGLGVRKDGPQPRIRRQVVAEDRRVEFPALEHGEHVLARRGALNERWIAVFGDMSVLERHPADILGREPVRFLHPAAQPQAGRLGIGAHADATAAQVLRATDIGLGAAEHCAFLKPRSDADRQQHQRLAAVGSASSLEAATATAAG